MEQHLSADKDRWLQIESVLDQLLDLESDHTRGELLSRLCGDDRELRSEVERLLRMADVDTDLLDQPIASAAPDLVSGLETEIRGGEDDRAGRTIDRYRLVEVLGRGGMGVVYLAERADQQFEKKVALKLMPRGLESPEKERRFVTERQILARLEHPGIARLLDGGVTEEGYPYLVMEYVDGVPIDRYCNDHQLTVGGRLELIREVCQAVHYAHQNLIVHRDLKPGNIFVTPDGEVKLLDFGVGKILESADSEEQTLFQPLTLDYASPEQLLNRPVSTASDIYSLGVLMFRVLTGALPYPSRGLGVMEIEARARETPLRAPSQAVAEPTSDAEHARSMDDRQNLQRQLRGDLDTIVLKALRWEPELRYRSVAELAEDIQRHLEGLPIEAHPSTFRYRATKFISRNRLAVSGGVLILLLLLAGIAGVAWQGRMAARQRDRARIEATKAERVADLLAGLFDAADPFSHEAGQLTTRELLDRGERRIRKELADDPVMLGELLIVMSRAYSGIGDFDKSLELAELAAENLDKSAPGVNSSLQRALVRVSEARSERGEYELAEKALQRAIDLGMAPPAVEPRDRARILTQLGGIQYRTGQPAEAVVSYRTALSLLRIHGTEIEMARALHGLSTALEDLGEYDTALEIKRETLEITQRIYGSDHPLVSEMTNDVAYNLHRAGDFEAAEALYLQALAIAERLLGGNHPGVAEQKTNLGKVLMDQGRFEEAESYLREAAEILRLTKDEDYFQRIGSEINLATLFTSTGRSDLAVPLYRDALARFQRIAGGDHLTTVRVESLLARALHRLGRLEEAERLYRHALDAQKVDAPPTHVGESQIGLGSLLCDRGAATSGRPLLEEGIETDRQILPAGHWRIGEAEIELGRTLFELGDLEQASSLLADGKAKLSRYGISDPWILSRVTELESRLQERSLIQ